jgi:hypothetical protein
VNRFGRSLEGWGFDAVEGTIKARLDPIDDMGLRLARLVSAIDWRFLEERLGRSLRTSRASRRCRHG